MAQHVLGTKIGRHWENVGEFEMNDNLGELKIVCLNEMP